MGKKEKIGNRSFEGSGSEGGSGSGFGGGGGCGEGGMRDLLLKRRMRSGGEDVPDGLLRRC